MLHLVDRLQSNANALDAPEADAVEVLVQAIDLAARLSDLHIDATGDVLARAAQIVLLAREALVQAGELIAQGRLLARRQDRLPRVPGP